MTRHQIHLKNIRKMRELGYELISDPILMRRLFGDQKSCICPPSKPRLKTTFGGGTFISFKRNGMLELYFSTWKKLGNWIHDYFEIEMVKKAASGVLNSEQKS